MMVKFLVIDLPSAYNEIIRQPSLNTHGSGRIDYPSNNKVLDLERSGLGAE